MERQTGVLEKLLGEAAEPDRVAVIGACSRARDRYPHAAGTAAFAAANGDWPLTRWIALEAVKRKSQWNVSGRLPIIVGITGPQGCGKTTLCASLLAGLGALGIKAAASSMDDFYLPTKFLSPVVFLGENCSGQKLLPRRGPPGTHDINLCRSVLESIKQRKPNIMLPKYDKSQMNGRGDRSNEAVLLDATDIDVFLLEGWMLGFRHVDPKVLTGWNFSEPQRSELHQVNESLKDYEPLYTYIDLWLVVKVETPQWVYKWRRQQEEDTRKQTGSGMTAGEVDGFVDRFMPLYTVYLPGLYANPPLSGGDPRDRRCLLVEVTEQRIVKYAAFI